MARLALAVGTGAVLQTTLLAGTVIAVGAEYVGRGITHIRLAEASYEARCSARVTREVFLKKVRRDALIVARYVCAVLEDRGAVGWVPGEYTHVLAIRRALEAEERQRRVGGSAVLGSLCRGVVEVGI